MVFRQRQENVAFARKTERFPAEAANHCNRLKKRKVSGRGGKTLRSLEKTKGLNRKHNVKGRTHEEIKGGLKYVENHRAVRIFSHTPGPSIFVDMSRKSGPGGGWAGNWEWASPLPPLALSTSSWPNEGARPRSKPTTDARRDPSGGGGLPLPAAASAAP